MPLGGAAIATIAGSALTAGTGLVQSLSAGKAKRQAQQAMEDYQRQQLTNPYANLQVSTAGADLQRQDLARSVSTFADNAALGGSRAIVGLMPNVLQQQIAQEQKIAADLDQQYIQNQQLAAQGQGMVMQMTEQREKDDLLGIGQAYQTARAEQAAGYQALGQAGLGIGMAAAGGLFKGAPQQLDAFGDVVGKAPNIIANGTSSAEYIGSQLVNQPQQLSLQGSPLIQQNPSYLNTKMGGVIQPSWMNYLYAQPTYKGF